MGKTPALFTDLYQLTMAQAYWQSGVTGSATFSLFIRTYPPDRAYFVLAGVEDAVEYLQEFEIAEDDVEFLRSTGKLDAAFLDYLAGLRFTGKVRAMPEATIFFANEPVVEITAPIVEAQIVETALVNKINLHTILATKAARVVHAARGRTVVDFGARRTHGVEAAIAFARAGYMAGFAGTSNVLAGKIYDIPTFGTMAHFFIMAFHDEVDAFRAYANSFPDSSTLLVDTYDTAEGVGNAIAVARELRERGHSPRAVRLDSGDLLKLAVTSRTLLDAAGLRDVEIFASGGLDEFEIERLLDAGAPIDGFAVGTKVGVSADAPWTDCAYKLVEYDGRATLKLSSDKQSLPGPKQVYRTRDAGGRYLRDTICRADEEAPESDAKPLLVDVMEDGKRLRAHELLLHLRERFAAEFLHLSDDHKSLESPTEYEVEISPGLQELYRQASKQARTTK